MKKRSVLVVEDNELNLEMLCSFIEEKFDVIKAYNGLEALNYLKTSVNDVSLILTDVNMPVMNGYEFLDELKKDKELSLIPVIVMTQENSESEELLALSHGANDFLPKPYRPQIILHRITNMIKLKEVSSLINIIKNDKLTGLYTKEYFFLRVEDILKQDPEGEYSIISTNIENFKVFNEVNGSKKGDEILTDIASFILKSVPQHAIVGRLNADKFLILMKTEDEKMLREHFLETVDDNFKEVYFKLGVYQIVDKNMSVSAMVDRAVIACDSINGKFDSLVADFEEKLKDKLLRENSLIELMEDALVKREYKVFYQPKYDLKKNELKGSEALVRWLHDDKYISPSEFIPLFEQNGFINELDKYVLNEVFAFLKEQKENNVPLFPISVNISRVDILKADLINYLNSLIEKYQIEAKYVHLEITESAYTDNDKIIFSTIDELRKIGFVVEMDDFGSGYSSLSMFSQINIDYLKLDMYFIKNELENDDDANLVSFIIDFAHKKGIKVVAEGVETYQQVKKLNNFDCDLAQGYYFSKPLNRDDYLNLISSIEITSNNEEKYINGRKSKEIIVYFDNDPIYESWLNKAFKNKYDIKMFNEDGINEFIKTKKDNFALILINPSSKIYDVHKLVHDIRVNPKLVNVPILALIDSPNANFDRSIINDADEFMCKHHPCEDFVKRAKNLIKYHDFQNKCDLYSYEANHDFVTSLLNRRGLKRKIEELDNSFFPCYLYLFDIDNLKSVNDSSGHESGDKAIAIFGNVINNFSYNNIIARYGGDEFIFITNKLKNEKEALEFGEKISILYKKEAEKENINVSCSSGCSVFTSKKDLEDNLVKKTDKGLYKAKNVNKGHCIFLNE